MNVRSILAAALAATLAVPALATAQSRRASPAARAPAAPASAGQRGLSVGGFLGYEMGDLDGLMLRLDAEMKIQNLNPKVVLSGVGSVGYTRFSANIPYGDITWNVFKLIPAARLTMPVSPELSLYGDGGLGLYHARGTAKVTFPGFPSTSSSSSTTGVVMRLGAGAFYKVNPRTRLAGSLELDPYLSGDADTTNFTIMAGLMMDL